MMTGLQWRDWGQGDWTLVGRDTLGVDGAIFHAIVWHPAAYQVSYSLEVWNRTIQRMVKIPCPCTTLEEAKRYAEQQYLLEN